MLFAVIGITFPEPVGHIPPNHRIPDDAVSADEKARLIRKGFAVEHAPEAVVPPAAPVVPAPETPVLNSQWAFDPASVKNDTLDVLNMKIAGHVEKHGLAPVAPFDDAEEARTFMSLEWPKD